MLEKQFADSADPSVTHTSASFAHPLTADSHDRRDAEIFSFGSRRLPKQRSTFGMIGGLVDERLASHRSPGRRFT